MMFSELVAAYPATAKMWAATHGGTLEGFAQFLGRTIADTHRHRRSDRLGCGSGARFNWQPWHMRAATVRILAAQSLGRSCSTPLAALRDAIWEDGTVLLELRHAQVYLDCPPDVYAEHVTALAGAA